MADKVSHEEALSCLAHGRPIDGSYRWAEQLERYIRQQASESASSDTVSSVAIALVDNIAAHLPESATREKLDRLRVMLLKGVSDTVSRAEHEAFALEQQRANLASVIASREDVIAGLEAKLTEQQEKYEALDNAYQTVKLERDAAEKQLTEQQAEHLRECSDLNLQLGKARGEAEELARQLKCEQAEHGRVVAELAQAQLSAKNWKRNWEIASTHETELEGALHALNDAAADLVAEAVGPYDPPQRGSNLEKLYRLVTRPTPASPPPEQAAPSPAVSENDELCGSYLAGDADGCTKTNCKLCKSAPSPAVGECPPTCGNECTSKGGTEPCEAQLSSSPAVSATWLIDGIREASKSPLAQLALSNPSGLLPAQPAPVLDHAPRGNDVFRQQPPRKIALKGPAAPSKLVKQIVRVTSRLGQLHQSDEPIGGRLTARDENFGGTERCDCGAGDDAVDHNMHCNVAPAPAPAEPQGRTEQADRPVMLSEMLAALETSSGTMTRCEAATALELLHGELERKEKP